MPYTADQYRRAAEEAKQLAAKAMDSCERVQLLRLAAAGRLQGETRIQAIAPINRSITDKYPPQLAELGPAAHHGAGSGGRGAP